ncbi:MAG: mannose-1-phosphate guanylyltransferase, partial [Aquificaceae bacterium]
MKVLILSGGSGTRLFPLSRDRYPKQFLSIFGGKSLLQKTVERALLISGFLEDIIFLSNRNYLNHIRNQVEELFGAYPKHVVLEPVKRNTAPAIVLGLVCMLEKGILKEDEPVLVLPSDHIVSPVDKFIEVVKRAEPVAEEGYMVTFGIKPTRPETGYGYIEADKVCLGSGYRVKLFHEKPTLEKAREYLLAVNFFWNSGMFCFTPRTFFEELRLYCKDIYTQIEGKEFEEIKEGFENIPDISIDYAIMEKTERAVVIPMELYWSDVGSFDAICKVLEKDENQNGVSGEYVGIDSENNLIITTGKPVATVGITDTIVVSTDDMTVVIKKGQSQQT